MTPKELDQLYQQATTRIAVGGGPMMRGPIDGDLVLKAVADSKLASWYALLLRAVREWDVSWPDRGGVTIPCEFDAEGRPVENAALRAAIEGCLDQPGGEA